MERYLEYAVRPGSNVPQGLPGQRLAVLSRIWRAPALTLEYPDGVVWILTGWSGNNPGGPCEVLVFWTRSAAAAPAVALAIGGDGGLRHSTSGSGPDSTSGLPFLALAESLIPKEVLAVIGPPPKPKPEPLRLLI